MLNKKQNFIRNYFYDQIDYPGEIAFDPLPINVVYNYVSNSFLNGFINYVEIVKAYTIGRYVDWDKPFEEDEEDYETIQVRKNSALVKIKVNNALERYTALIQPGAVFHSRLDKDFLNDVLILSKAWNQDKTKFKWVYFWFDTDSSDCSIGRFETEDSDSIVVDSFTEYVKTLHSNSYGEKEIPLHYFIGWLNS